MITEDCRCFQTISCSETVGYCTVCILTLQKTESFRCFQMQRISEDVLKTSANICDLLKSSAVARGFQRTL